MPDTAATKDGALTTNKNVARTAATKAALVDAAFEIFAEKGYEATSVADILRRSGVKRGSLYHHFSGKLELFEAAFGRVGEIVTPQTQKAVAGESDPWEVVRLSMLATLDASLDPAVGQILIRDATTALGWELCRSHMNRRSLGALKTRLHGAMGADASDERVEAAAHLILGAMMEASALISSSEDPVEARKVVGAALETVIAAFRD